jgi:DNA-binding response OmpR family regulator
MTRSRGIASSDVPCILVAEDDPDIRQLLQDRLGGMGYRVQPAVDGVTALDAVRTETFQGMILDMSVSTMEGLDVLQEIRKLDQQLPIVMVTASGAKESAVRAIGLGAQAYMLKPFDVDQLQRVADYWFRPSDRLSWDSAGESSTPGQ